ncbi:MAG TPA: hypothetical protein VE685_24200 [Thermoanaerobaculia bacterium]|nr:hypothetical protein [Thermoanaerobaculia bacterium]
MKKFFALVAALGLCAVLSAPVPSSAYTCQDFCLSDYNSCKLDCRFHPYTGCANDCWQEYQACLAAC